MCSGPAVGYLSTSSTNIGLFPLPEVCRSWSISVVPEVFGLRLESLSSSASHSRTLSIVFSVKIFKQLVFHFFRDLSDMMNVTLQVCKLRSRLSSSHHCPLHSRSKVGRVLSDQFLESSLWGISTKRVQPLLLVPQTVADSRAVEFHCQNSVASRDH